jgi:hypothetical protein
VLKPGGVALCHAVVDDARWRTEAQWRQDRSLRGRLRWEFGLHCFSRAAADVAEAVVKAGFTRPTIEVIRTLHDIDDDIREQHLLTFRRPMPARSRSQLASA